MPSHVTFDKASLTSAVKHVLLVAKIYFCFAQPQDVTEKASTNGLVANRVQSQPGAAQGPNSTNAENKLAKGRLVVGDGSATSDSTTTGTKMMGSRRSSPSFVLNLRYKSSPLWDTRWWATWRLCLAPAN
ncbi:hypothetical protein B5807_10985 [Epicoccum nigrum]|jgi:hypothetical protein|uniref:Uncharacterized protein n=1 Tax=Epicoccum nigrum TaxID=105696 RepID=A0A1Y2LKE2_EPING|nr:hypothetical protein B5807_10985 [Epicoccum nigrum]